MRCYLALVAVALVGCGGTLNQSGVRDSLGYTLLHDPALASAICGYAVAGLVTTGPAGEEYLGVDASKPSSGPPEARIRGVPVPAPGVPVGKTCEGRIQFGYTPVFTSSAGRGGVTTGEVVVITGIVKVLERMAVVPDGLRGRYVYGTPNFVIPISLEQAGQPLMGRWLWGPGEPAERMVADYELVVAAGASVHIKASCGSERVPEREPSGHLFPKMILFDGDTQVASMSMGDNLDADVYPAHPADHLIEIAWNGGTANGFILWTPGTYRLQVAAECRYQLFLDQRAGAIGASVRFTPAGEETFPERKASAAVEMIAGGQRIGRGYTLLGHLEGEHDALGTLEELVELVNAKVRQLGGHALINHELVTTPGGAVNLPRGSIKGDVVRWIGPNVCRDDGTCSLD